ncbi:MAG: ribosomal protein L7/L12 [Planctomycetes bacterium]|nr:ribosomal protein L7/L12 [Planctomycetota bacterium]
MFDDAVFWLSLGTLIVVLFSLARRCTPPSNNSRIERKLDLILDHLGINPHQDVDQKILDCLQSGQKIEAIKLYREQTGVGLKEAKDYVEGLQDPR